MLHGDDSRQGKDGDLGLRMTVYGRRGLSYRGLVTWPKAVQACVGAFSGEKAPTLDGLADGGLL